MHQADDGTYAVLAVFFEANNSADSTFLTALHTNLPAEEGKKFGKSAESVKRRREDKGGGERREGE